MTEWHGGKGSKPRPYSVSQDEYDKRWDAIFGKDLPEDENEDNELDDEDFDDEHTEEE